MFAAHPELEGPGTPITSSKAALATARLKEAWRWWRGSGAERGVVQSFSKEAKLSQVPSGDSCLKIVTPTTSCSRALITNPATVPEHSAQLSLYCLHSAAATRRSTPTPPAPSRHQGPGGEAARRGGGGIRTFGGGSRYSRQATGVARPRLKQRASRNSGVVPANQG